jgi:hypothetical protein
VLDDRDPARIQLGRPRRRTATGYAIRLLDERDRDRLGAGGLRRLYASAGPVTEHERRARLLDLVQMGAGGTVRRVELEDRRR